jgi:hypothetical protein
MRMIANTLLKLKLLYLNLKYRRMQKSKPGFEWSTVADMPLRKKELKRAVKKRLVESRQIKNKLTGKCRTLYRFNRANFGKYYFNKTWQEKAMNKLRKIQIKKWRKLYGENI